MKVIYGAMEVPALKSVDLDIHPSNRVAIAGKSSSENYLCFEQYYNFMIHLQRD